MSADTPIPALQPRGPGHRFVVYGDSCSGVPGAPHEACFAEINRTVARLVPPPEFMLFTGDEIAGLTPDEAALRAQWRHWLDVEMAWLDRRAIPLYHTTSNHTTWDAASEAVFRDALAYLPRNGPVDQPGLSYVVRRGDLAMVFVHTAWSRLGGEGHVETTWLAETLRTHRDARHKLVIGHHPAHAVNGYGAPCQHVIAPEHAAPFWRLLVDEGVFAYVCSHILAFDIQVHEGVLQLTTAGAGTKHRMPEGVEYLHAVQMALDDDGLRYQVLDGAGARREQLAWPPALPAGDGWSVLDDGAAIPAPATAMAWHLRGYAAAGAATMQTLVAAASPDALSPLWIGLTGPEQRLTVMLAPQVGRSPHYWHGPTLAPGQPFDLEVLVHRDMGPGGILARTPGTGRWSSLRSTSPWGAERLPWPTTWRLGRDPHAADRNFRGTGLAVTTAAI